MKAIVIVSGGLDSVTLAYEMAEQTNDLHFLSFDYGQRHRKELHFARLAAKRLGARHDLIDLTGLTTLISNSSLTNTAIPVPDGHYAETTMKATVVPNRNAIMLSIAYGVAVSEEASVLALGVHAGDHFIYPDCRPDFIAKLGAALSSGNQGFGDPDLKIVTPYIGISKADIVRRGAVRVPYTDTWSCYKGGDVHCGVCGTCSERREAFVIAGISDPTVYAVTDDVRNF